MSFASSSSKPPRSEEKDRGRLRSLFSFSSMFEMISSNKKYSSFYVLPSSLSSSLSYCNVCIDVKSNKTDRRKKNATKKRYLSSSVLFVRE